MHESEPRNIHAIVIPRSDPKDLPDRNLHVVFGRPLILWVLEALKSSRRLTGYYISTGDEHLAGACREAGCEIIDRPDKLDGNRVSRVEILRHAVKSIYSRHGLTTHVAVGVRASIPELQGHHIDDAIDFLDRNKLREVITVGMNDIENDDLRVIHHRALFADAPSYRIGIVRTDFVNVRSIDDTADLQHRYESRQRFEAVRG
jgi:CMP-N-acetylneuraminic acid synthetase